MIKNKVLFILILFFVNFTIYGQVEKIDSILSTFPEVMSLIQNYDSTDGFFVIKIKMRRKLVLDSKNTIHIFIEDQNQLVKPKNNQFNSFYKWYLKEYQLNIIKQCLQNVTNNHFYIENSKEYQDYTDGVILIIIDGYQMRKFVHIHSKTSFSDFKNDINFQNYLEVILHL